MKSLGTIAYPVVTLESFEGSTGKVTLRLVDGRRKLKIVIGVGCARKMVDISRDIVGKQRAHTLSQWNLYKGLKSYTGFKPPEGEE